MFNIAGYRLFFGFAEQQASAQLAAQVERQAYDADEIITLAVPLTLPYQTDWTDWEQVRGEIEIDGIRYQYVQRKVEGGQMYLQCLPNKQQAKIESARDRFFQLANVFQDDNTQKGTSGSTVKFSKPALSDFDDQNASWSITVLPILEQVTASHNRISLSHPYLLVLGQPPDASC